MHGSGYLNQSIADVLYHALPLPYPLLASCRPPLPSVVIARRAAIVAFATDSWRCSCCCARLSSSWNDCGHRHAERCLLSPALMRSVAWHGR